MSVFKCKMCGNDIDITGGTTVCECEYCGTEQTVPDVSDNKIRSVFIRANILRLKGSFDKAAQLYTKLLPVCPKEPEVSWGLLLCKYGVEYVEDPRTFDISPVCRRPSEENVLEDELYKKVMQLAHSAQREIYEEEAKKIESTRRAVIDRASSEKSSEVFISCLDSDKAAVSAAREICAGLRQKGKTVFCAAVDLKDKPRSEREPMIYAALNSAEIMLVLGNEAGSFIDPGIRNEWVRFLRLAEQDNRRVLVPCYGNMDVYEMPEELARLNFRRMDKQGFVESVTGDVLSGSVRNPEASTSQERVVPEEKPAVQVSKAEDERDVVAGDIGNGFVQDKPKVLHTEESKQSAKEEKPVIEDKPAKEEKPVIEDKPAKEEKPVIEEKPIIEEKPVTKETAPVTKLTIPDAAAAADPNPDYAEAMKLLRTFNPDSDDLVQEKELLTKVKDRLSAIPDYKNSLRYIMACNDRIKEIDYQRAVACYGMGNMNEAWLINNRNAFIALGDYKESAEYARMCDERIRMMQYDESYKLYDFAEKNITLNKHLTAPILKQSIDDLEKAKALFIKLKDYKKSEDYLKKLNVLLEDANESYTEMCRQAVYEKSKAAKKRKLIAIIGTSIVAAAIVVSGVLTTVLYIIPESKYNNALSLMDEGMYNKAADVFDELGDYKDSHKKKISALALNAFTGLSDSQKSDIRARGRIISSGQVFAATPLIIGVKPDGTVAAVGADNEGMKAVSGWNGITSLSVRKGHIVGLKTDGTVLAAGNNEYGQCDVSGWTGVVEIAAGSYHTVGLMANGTVAAVGSTTYGQCNVSGWKNIKAIAAGDDYTAGLTGNGTVLVTRITVPDDAMQYDTSSWSDVVAISAGDDHLVGLKADGTVCAVGLNDSGQCDVSDWTGIVAISAGSAHTVGLRADGTVVAVGNNYSGKCSVSDWTDIVAINAGYDHTLGLRADGTVLATGNTGTAEAVLSSWHLKNS